MSELKSNSSMCCNYCQRYFTSLSRFKECGHKICVSCLFQRIFINNIQDFTGVSKINVKCKCGNGDLDETLNDISSIIMKKTELDKNNKDEDTREETKMCPTHTNSYLNYYCIECFNHICKKCQADEHNDHHSHRVLSCLKLKRIIKNNIEQNLFLKFDDNSFQIICDNISAEIQKEVEMFNKTIDKVDDLIKTICDFRDEYIKKYKVELKNIVQNFKILKVYYMNYYNDLKIAKENQEKCNNINFLRYVNNISYEFEDMKIEHNETLSLKISEFTNFLDKFKKGSSKLINAHYFFTEGKRDYIMEQNYLNKVHEGFISSLVELTNERILTSSRKDFRMKIFKEDEENNIYQEVKEIKGKCGCVLYSKEDNKIFTGDANGDISIYEEKKNNDYVRVTTLSYHEKQINTLAKISDDKIVSGGNDHRVVVWKMNEDKQYYYANSIKMNRIILNVIALFDERIAFTCDDSIIYIYKQDDNFEKKQKDITDYILDQELKGKHKGMVNCLCQLNNSYIISGGAEKKVEKIKDKSLIVWRTDKDNSYIYSQSLKGHNGDITSIIQLRDGNFASSSADHTIKIWKEKKVKDLDYISYELAYNIEYPHGIYKMIQLEDDRICAASSTFQILFWRNRSGSY